MLHKIERMKEFEKWPVEADEDLKKLYEIFEQAYQVLYDKVKAESDKVMEGFKFHSILLKILLHVRNLNNDNVSRTVPFELERV